MLRHALAVTDFIENPSQSMLMFLETIRRLIFALLEFWDPDQDEEVEALLLKYEEAAKTHAGAEATTMATLPTADPNVVRVKITTGELVSYMRVGTPTPGRAYQNRACPVLNAEPGMPSAGEAELLAAMKDHIVTSRGPPSTFEFLAYDLRAFLHKRRGSLHPTPYTLKPETRNPKTENRNPKPDTLHPKPETRNPKPDTRNPKPETRNPKPETLNPKS